MMRHHEESIDHFVRLVQVEHTCDAVIVEGSVARGTERSDSDIDLYLLVSDEMFDEARRAGRLSYVTGDGVTYEGGYFDIKLVTLDYLDKAASHGDDPCRASFESARVVWSRVHGLEARLARIRQISESSWIERQATFIAHARLQNWYFIPQAEKLGNTFLLHHAAVHLVMAAGRALLASNRVLFKAPKYLERTVAELPSKPFEYERLAARALADPGQRSASSLMEALEAFRDWPLPLSSTLSRYVEENELSWLTGVMPPEYS
jgi:predicted nucleotidyltransferase